MCMYNFAADFFLLINRGNAVSYPFWVVSFGGPIVIIAAVIHAALRRPYSIFTAAIVSKVCLSWHCTLCISSPSTLV